MLPASARMGNVCASGLNSDKFDDLTCERQGNLAGARDGGRRRTQVMRLEYLSAQDVVDAP